MATERSRAATARVRAWGVAELLHCASTSTVVPGIRSARRAPTGADTPRPAEPLCRAVTADGSAAVAAFAGSRAATLAVDRVSARHHGGGRPPPRPADRSAFGLQPHRREAGSAPDSTLHGTGLPLQRSAADAPRIREWRTTAIHQQRCARAGGPQLHRGIRSHARLPGVDARRQRVPRRRLPHQKGAPETSIFDFQQVEVSQFRAPFAISKPQSAHLA